MKELKQKIPLLLKTTHLYMKVNTILAEIYNHLIFRTLKP